MLQTHAEKKRVRACQMWSRAGSDRMNSTKRTEILSEPGTGADGMQSRERSDFCRFGFATLGLATPAIIGTVSSRFVCSF